MNSDVEVDNPITYAGDVHLILCDNKTLTAPRGISSDYNQNLTIYAQSTGDKMGKLNVTGSSKNGSIWAAHDITINGGDVQAIVNNEDKNSGGVGVRLGDGRGTAITIGENVGFFLAAGPGGAFEDTAIVKNGIAGTGWENADGTGTTASIPTSTEGQTLNYKRVQFPASDDVQRVVDMITALPDPAKVTANDEKAIREARKAYDNLSEPQKQNRRLTQAIKDKLSNCEAALAKAVDQQAASKVSGQIAAIPGDPSQATSAQVATAAAACDILPPLSLRLEVGASRLTSLTIRRCTYLL